MYALGSCCQPLHFRIQPGWPPPDALPARGTASPNSLSGNCGYSCSTLVRSSRCWSRSLTRHRLSTASCMAACTRWPRPDFSRWNSAVTMPSARCSPVPLSPICAPVTSGGAAAEPGGGGGARRRAVVEAGGGRGAAGALRDVLVHLAVLVRAGAEALDRRHDHARVDLLDLLPGEAHAIERAGREVLHQHVALLDQRGEDLLALGILGVDRDRALVVVQHREVQA